MRVEMPMGIPIPPEAKAVREDPERGVVEIEIPLPEAVEAAIREAYDAFARGAEIVLIPAALIQGRLALRPGPGRLLHPSRVSRMDLALAWLREGRIPVPVFIGLSKRPDKNRE